MLDRLPPLGWGQGPVALLARGPCPPWALGGSGLLRALLGLGQPVHLEAE